MADFQPIHIPPQGIPSIEPKKTGKMDDPKLQPGQPSFQESLRKQLGQVKQDAEEVVQKTNPSLEEVEKVMQDMKSLYENTMQAHQMMQQLIKDVQVIDEKTRNTEK